MPKVKPKKQKPAKPAPKPRPVMKNVKPLKFNYTIPQPASFGKKKKLAATAPVEEAPVVVKKKIKAAGEAALGLVKLDLEKMAKYKEQTPKQLAKGRKELLSKMVRDYSHGIERESTRWVAIAQDGHVRLVLARDQEDVFFVSFDSQELMLERQAFLTFRRHFAPYPYELKIAADKWLHSQRFTSVTDQARAELEAIIKGQPSPLQQEIIMAEKGKKGKKGAAVVTSKVGAAVIAKQKGKGSGRKPGSGARIRELLMEGRLDAEAIVKIIHKEFPGSKATEKDVSWNRSFLKKEGKKVPEPKVVAVRTKEKK